MSEQSTSGPQTGMDRIFGALRGLGIRRRTDDKWIAGVCSGLADRMGIDPVIVRAALVLLSLLGGTGITIYLLAWALIPNDRDEIVAQRALRDGDGGSIVLIIFAALALFGGSAFGGPWWVSHSGWGFPWGVFLIALFIWWLVKRSDNRAAADQPVRAQQLGTPAAAGPSPTAAGPVVPQTQVLSQSQAVPQTQVVPQSQLVPKRLRRRSGGPLMALLAMGLALASYGSLILAGNAFSWTGNHATIALAGSLAAIGLLSVVLGLAGWRAGFVAFLAVVLAIAAWTSTVVPAGIHVDGRVGDATWTPTSISSGANSGDYRLGVGNGVLDLSKLATQGLSTAANPATIPVSVGMGELKVLVPQGLNVKVVGHVSLGEILAPTDTSSAGQGGSEVSRTIVVGQGPTTIVVNAGVGIGQLKVVKE
jgi:phage shock protein PspC (stress-responsive transcriptional regulator)